MHPASNRRKFNREGGCKFNQEAGSRRRCKFNQEAGSRRRCKFNQEAGSRRRCRGTALQLARNQGVCEACLVPPLPNRKNGVLS
ncbi:hypothetical protein T484DRAFT_1853188 [Baffinella frigidus]|nr:hypothetical protein T484DRAFT_1853188 [Cryptophyta sp. CCMP2293]